MPELFFEDFEPGAVTTFGRWVVDRDAMVAFAREFDAQPFHLSEDEARGTLAGRLIASGWYTCCLQMRLIADEWLLRAASLGAPGIDEVKWLKPVAAGDVLSVRQTVLDKRLSRSREDRGLVRFAFVLQDGSGGAVMTQANSIMFGRRDRPASARPAAAVPADVPEPPPAAPVFFRDFEDVAIGVEQPLGSYAFTTANILHFARRFDPQLFHIDEVAAEAGPFGRLAASGWHTASAWMRCLVRHRQAAAVAAGAAGVPAPRFGVSPGFRDLRWLRPVHPGETIRFSTVATDKRASLSRPGWGIVFNRSFGVNDGGETVFEFSGSGFYARREGGRA